MSSSQCQRDQDTGEPHCQGTRHHFQLQIDKDFYCWFCLVRTRKSGMVAHTCNPSTLEESRGDHGHHLQLWDQWEARRGYKRLCHKTKQEPPMCQKAELDRWTEGMWHMLSGKKHTSEAFANTRLPWTTWLHQKLILRKQSVMSQVLKPKKFTAAVFTIVKLSKKLITQYWENWLNWCCHKLSHYIALRKMF